MATKGKPKRNNQREASSQGQAIPTLMAAMREMDKAAPNMGVESVRGRVPRRRPNPGITPRFKKLK